MNRNCWPQTLACISIVAMINFIVRHGFVNPLIENYKNMDKYKTNGHFCYNETTSEKKKRTQSIKTAKTTLRGKSLDVLHHMSMIMVTKLQLARLQSCNSPLYSGESWGDCCMNKLKNSRIPTIIQVWIYACFPFRPTKIWLQSTCLSPGTLPQFLDLYIVNQRFRVTWLTVVEKIYIF